MRDAWSLVRFKNNKRPLSSFKITKLGDTNATASCKHGFNEPGYLFCEGLAGEFRFNRKNGRFIFVSLLGYYNVLPQAKISDETSDTPFIEIGKCSPM